MASDVVAGEDLAHFGLLPRAAREGVGAAGGEAAARGWVSPFQLTKERIFEALELLEQAIEIDRHYGVALHEPHLPLSEPIREEAHRHFMRQGLLAFVDEKAT